MEPELEELIASFPEVSEESAKLIFIRKSAQRAYEEGEIKQETFKFFKEIVTIATTSNMSKEDISSHIGNLETIRDYLAAFTQGMTKGYVSDEAAKIKERKKKEAVKKKKSKKKETGSSVEDLIALAMSGSLKMESKKAPPTDSKPESDGKQECEKCHTRVYSLKYHTCSS